MVTSLHSYALIGWPVKHSFSANFFAEKFKALGIDGSYKLIPLRNIAALRETLTTYHVYGGFNVTIPHKQDIIPFLSGLSAEAKEIGAVNTVKIIHHPHGVDNPSLIGYNTDYIGFTRSLKPLLRNDITHALILGYGGASRAVIYSLIKLGITPIIASRTPGKHHDESISGQTLEFIGYDELTSDVIKRNQLIINTTPLGMWPDTENCTPIPWEFIDNHHICYDLVYNPIKTKFLTKAEARGALIKNGLEMLHLQAEAAWSIWTNQL